VDQTALTVSKPALLLYVDSSPNPGRYAVAPALAAAAQRAGWSFECYYDSVRRGRHFGGGRVEDAATGWQAGSLVAGGRHADQILRLATAYELVALGDPDSVLWPALDEAGADELIRSLQPQDIYAAAFERLGQPLPGRVLLLETAPRGTNGVIVAPYLYPAFFAGGRSLGLAIGVHDGARAALERLGVTEFVPVAPDLPDGDYAQVTSALARAHADWGEGILLGDPELVAAQLPKAARLRLLPLYGRPQVDVITQSAKELRAARGPVYGRQFDDRDFFELARLGHGLQVLDPEPPFDASFALPWAVPLPEDTARLEPDDAQLAAWAGEGRILVTLLFWAGMIRELDCIPRLIDLTAETELRAGLLATAETFDYGAGFSLELLAAPPGRGGVLGLLEPLLGSTGRAVAAESLLPAGTLATDLAEARASASSRLPDALAPRGWWPLLDTGLVPRRTAPVGWSSGRPVVRFTPRGAEGPEAEVDTSRRARRDLRGLAASTVRRLHLDAWFEERRPFDGFSPGSFDEGLAAAVHAAGFSYMWSKAGFGASRVLHRDGDFVALSLTAGNWDGWSPFYTVGSAHDLERAERRLLRSGPGWLVGTIDSPLWALSGEALERSSALYAIARHVSNGGRSGRLVNVTPNVIARYARVLDDRDLLSGRETSRNP